MREELLEILQDVRPDVDFEKEQKLIGDGILESFDIISLVSELNDAFDIEITPRELKPENFNSLDAMLALIQRLQEE
ncbi:acyl carrier protein [Lachnoclostridium sp. Marseille-P6806]|uniref:acyl carrier protein n=1 Tax=Lachnoclostridium sp. Marseille-P6806 TaxID=2364793 RepID=UPI0010310DE9|nr:phosphopantetheine-binding protein [Lachnoclostridium sp. Marseille-P6806]